MSDPPHAATRASARAHGMNDLRVSQPTRLRLYIRSLRKQYACANCLATEPLRRHNGRRITYGRRSRLVHSSNLLHYLR
jgi:hypothetical protein